LRAAAPADAARVNTLWQELERMHAALQPDFFRPPRPPGMSTLDLARLLQDPHRLLAVAEIAGEVAGLVHAQIYDTPPQPLLTPRRRAHVDTLIVDAAYRRRGLGRALVEQASAWAKHRGAAEVLLTLWSGNRDAQGFYAALGFHTVNVCLSREV
jgi:ribosomal protein S18 acetylase RimI-like enzyme